MKTARLIKKVPLLERPSAKKQSAAQGTGLKRAVNVVKDWVKEHRTMQQEQSRQMFAALFTHPQS